MRLPLRPLRALRLRLLLLLLRRGWVRASDAAAAAAVPERQRRGHEQHRADARHPLRQRALERWRPADAVAEHNARGGEQLLGTPAGSKRIGTEQLKGS